MVLTREEKLKILKDNGPLFLETLYLFFQNDVILEKIHADGILIPSDVVTLKSESVKSTSIFYSVGLLRTGPMDMFHKFIKLLRENNQGEFADTLVGPLTQQASTQQPHTQQQAAAKVLSPDIALTWNQAQVEKFVDDKGFEIQQKLRPYMDAPLLANFVSGKVITNFENGEITNKTEVNSQLAKLMDFIREDAEKFHNFFKVLRKREIKFLDQAVSEFLAM